MHIPKRGFLKSSALLGAGTLLSPHDLSSAELDVFRVAVIGHSGRGDYGHGLDTVWNSVERTRIVAVSDPVEEGRTKAIKRLGVNPDQAFDDYEKMVQETAPDIVAVAPRHVDQHLVMAMAAAKSGARGIYIEKPFVRDLSEADELISCCDKHGTRLAIAHRNRYHHVLPVLKDLVEEGKIGELLEIRCRGKEDARGGCLDLWVLGSHLLNLALFFSDEATACSATIFRDGQVATPGDIVEGNEGIGPIAGNELHSRFDTKSGVPVFFDSIQNRGTKEAGFGLQLIGTKGVIDLRADREPLAHIRLGSPFLPSSEASPWLPVTSGGIFQPEPVENIKSWVGGHFAAIDDLFHAIEEERDPLCSARDGRAVLEMTMGVFESHRQGGARVDLPLQRRTHPFIDWKIS